MESKNVKCDEMVRLNLFDWKLAERRRRKKVEAEETEMEKKEMEVEKKDEEKGEISGRPMKQNEDKKGRRADWSAEGRYEGRCGLIFAIL